jgi:hypothetical protein
VIPIGTVLQPRDKADPVAEIVGIEADSYNLAPVEFGVCPIFQLDYDGITAAYLCDDYKVAIDFESEAEQWQRFSTERFDAAMNAQRRNPDEPRAPTPEQVFAAAAEVAAE